MMKKHLPILLAATLLSGCNTLENRHESALETATAGHMSERLIQAGPFQLTAFERISKPGAPADLYIEGDGLAWLDKYTPSRNPTPPHSVVLRMAAVDSAENVIYLARPCQYSGWTGNGACPDRYWTNARTAPEVIGAYNEALENIKATDGVSGFNLIGYSGGAAVAVLAAAGRADVLSIRTVAGNTDYALFSEIHSISPVNASVDPATVAAKLAHIPQRHFIGAEDKVVPEDIYNSWLRASGSSACITSTVVPDMGHEKGWDGKWPELLSLPLSCRTP
jgi:hypothetical protein